MTKTSAPSGFWSWADRHPKKFITVALLSYILNPIISDAYNTFKHPEKREMAAAVGAMKSQMGQLNWNFKTFLLSDSLNRKDTDRRLERLENRQNYHPKAVRSNAVKDSNHGIATNGK